LWRDIKNITKNNPFMRLCGATFLVFNGFQMVASFSYFIIVFYMYQGSYAAAGTVPALFSIIGAVVTSVLVIPVVAFLANKFGKRNAFIISTVISIIGYMLKWFGFVVVDANTTMLFKDAVLQIGVVKFSLQIPLIILLPVPLMAFGLGGLFTLMMSMTADVCDLDELRNGLPRREGTFGAIYWWMVKVGQSIALFLGGLVLALVGFDGGKTEQSLTTMTQLRIWDIVIPSLTAAMAIWVMWNYDLNETKVKAIKEELAQRRSELL
jgi:GPH family glycoside/pentoside/hexuronide:cation symporter